MKTNAPKIQLTNVTVDFPVQTSGLKSLFGKGKKVNRKKSAKSIALEDVSVSIAEGDRVGLLGKNGAGKSTFLRVLAGVYVPTNGHIEIRDEVTTVFNIKTGLDTDLSGRDNIPLLMAVQGIPLSRKDELTKEVEKFADLGAAFDRPMRTYSSGMNLRIAFAVATSVKSDILLMDEVIGVGDRWFRKRSKKRIDKMLKDAGTLVIASHSNAYLKAYCNRGLVFEKGKIVFDGDIESAIEFHNQSNTKSSILHKKTRTIQ